MAIELRPWTLGDAHALWNANRQSSDAKTQFGTAELASLDQATPGAGPPSQQSASCRVVTYAGFIPEGIERQKLLYGADRFDVEPHARLRTDASPDLAALPLSL